MKIQIHQDAPHKFKFQCDLMLFLTATSAELNEEAFQQLKELRSDNPKKEILHKFSWLRSMFASILIAVLLLACDSKDLAPPQKPVLIQVSRTVQGDPVPTASGSYLALPTRAVILLVEMPWPAEADVLFHGQTLERVPAGNSTRQQELEDNDLGYYSYDVNPQPSTAEWTFVISPPRSRRQSGMFKLDIVMISSNQNYVGNAKRSEPLVVQIRDNSGILTSTFEGYAVLEINHPDPNIKKLKRADVSFNVTFLDNDCILRLDTFPDIKTTYEVSKGVSNTTTVKWTKGGTGNYEWPSGTITLPIDLRFEHSIPLALPSDVHFDLTTATAGWPNWREDEGRPLDWTTGKVTLIGASEFKGGYLDRTRVRIALTGVFSKWP